MASLPEWGGSSAPGGATRDCERQLWAMADAFAERYELPQAEAEEGADPEARAKYTAENDFWVPQEARWDIIKVLGFGG